MRLSSKVISKFLLLLLLSSALAPSIPVALANEEAVETVETVEIVESSESSETSTEAVVESEDFESRTSSMTSGSEEDEAKTVEETATRLHPEIDEFTGALTYHYDIATPPGRSGLGANLSLDYNSGNEAKDSIVGFGWTLNIPSIERINRKGSEQLYNEDYFSSSISGELIAIDSTTYGAKSDKGDFLTYERVGDGWEVSDKSGTVYTFGSTEDARQDDPSDDTRIYKWMLEEIRDTNDNYVSYSYTKDSGQIYPSQITYTGHGSSDGIFTVDFTHDETVEGTSDSSRAFQVKTNALIDTITISISGTEVRSYELSYTTGSNGRMSLLESILESGTDEDEILSTLPATTFTYQAPDELWDLDEDWAMPSYETGGNTYGYHSSSYYKLTDVNGDELPDFVLLKATSGGGLITGNPATDVNYRVYLNTGTAWELDEGWSMPSYTIGTDIYGYGMQSTYYQIIDVNGDGLSDFIANDGGVITGDPVTDVLNRVYLNTGTGWEFAEDWTMPQYTSGAYTYGYDLYTLPEYTDLNADGLVDVIVSGSSGIITGDPALDYYNRVFINTGTAWTLDEDWIMPQYSSGGNVYGYEMENYEYQYVDVNADSLPDFIVMNGDPATNDPALDTNYRTFLNTGSGFELEENWTMPSYEISGSYYGYTTESISSIMQDVNGDGLADFFVMEAVSGYPITGDPAVDTNYRVYLNTGEGWELEQEWVMPTYSSGTSTYGYAYGNAPKLMDINGDSLVDFLVMASGEISEDANVDLLYRAFINTGNGWEVGEEWRMPSYEYAGDSYGYNTETGATQLLDVNGDSLLDFVAISASSGGGLITGDPASDTEYRVFLNSGKKGDRLSTISLSSGASISVNYEEVPIVDRNPYRQMQTFYAVSDISKDDGFGNTSTLAYEYEDGKFFFHDEHYRSFTGFGIVTVTDEEGKQRIVYNHQGNESRTGLGEYNDSFAKIGLPYRIEEYDSEGNLYNVTVQKWDQTTLSTGRTFAKLIRKTTLTYDGDTDHKDTAVEYTYSSSTGNPLTQISWGEVTANLNGNFTDVATADEKTTQTFTYATDASGIILDKLRSVRIDDASGTRVAEERYLYDSLALGSVSTGNLTGKQSWLNSPSSWISESYTVDSYGLTTGMTDARGYTTTLTYDSNNLYPETTTNALSQVTTTGYELRNGKVKSVTNPNGFTSETDYDGFGRPLTISVPDPTSGTTTLLTTLSYDDTSFPSSMSSSSTVSGVTMESRKYFDGFKRLIQEWKPAEGSYSTWVDYEYDIHGNLARTSLPYTGTSTSWTGLGSTEPSVESLYDTLGRPLSISTPSGTTSYDYDQWGVTTTDAEGHMKTQTFNANGALIQVDEVNGASTYTTAYHYDELGNLLSLTDAQGNVRNFTYDSLSRQKTQEDLHTPTAIGFGVWTSVYDANGNRTRTTDPKAQVITYSYDALSRLTREDWNNNGTNDVSYTYDGGSNGIGTLSRITMLSGPTVNYGHDKAGNVSSEAKLIGITTYTTSTTFDLLGRTSTVTYPGASSYTATTTYNSAGQIETVTKGTTSVVSDMDYDPSGQLAYVAYGNGTTTTNTYDPLEDNRLTHKVTTGSYNDGTTVTSGNIQDLTYAYDDIGNITSIVDASITSTAKTSTYTYDDLSRLLSVSTSGLSIGDYTESYTYDSVGNMTYKSDVGTLTYTGTGGTGSPNPHAVTSVAGVAYTYDANGNLTSDGVHSYTWNIKNQLTVTGAHTYSYDSQGTRYKNVKSGTPPTTSTYVNPYFEIRSGNQVSYIYAGSLRVASYESTQLSTYHQDHLGGTALSTNSSATSIQVYDYAPFGEEVINTKTGTIDASYSFTGKELEEDTGLYYFEARWYSPTIGRFVSEDPAQMDYRLASQLIQDPQSLNYYAYSRNNPLSYTDPTGEEFNEETAWDAFVMWVDAAIDGTSAVTKGFSAGMTAPSGVVGSTLGANLAVGAVADFNDGLVASTNAMGNTINAFQGDETQTFMTEGPLDQFLPEETQTTIDGLQTTSDLVQLGTNTVNTVKNIQNIENVTTSSYNTVKETMVQIFEWTYDFLDTTLDVATGENSSQILEK